VPGLRAVPCGPGERDTGPHGRGRPHAVLGRGACQPDARGHRPLHRRYGHVPNLLPVLGSLGQRDHNSRHLRQAAR
jgi:hypothetical protein